MQFARPLREGIRQGRIRCSIRIWMNPRVKAGGRYPMGDGHIIVDSIEQIELSEVTEELAQQSGFPSVNELLRIARHGRGENVYLIRFHYLRAGAWDTPGWRAGDAASGERRDGVAARRARARRRRQKA
jgi:hypothetical protein